MIFLIVMLFFSVSCFASHDNENKTGSQKAEVHKSMIREIYHGEDASIENIKIHEQRNRYYEISTIIFEKNEPYNRRQTISYYKRYQDVGAFCLQPSGILKTKRSEEKPQKSRRRERVNSIPSDFDDVRKILKFKRIVINDEDLDF